MKKHSITRAPVGAIALLVLCGSGHAQEPFKIDVGAGSPAIHVHSGRQIVEAVPAFEDYGFMMFDACQAMALGGEDCMVYPMNAVLGGNAIATIADGNKVIVYDRELSSIIGSAGAEMLIAHELAHHYCGHLGRGEDPELELEADAFAGAAMKLMGRSIEDAMSAVELFSARASRSHPAKSDRVVAITAGWNRPEAGKNCLGRRR